MPTLVIFLQNPHLKLDLSQSCIFYELIFKTKKAPQPLRAERLRFYYPGQLKEQQESIGEIDYTCTPYGNTQYPESLFLEKSSN
jgi:hypothetical protein